MSIPAPRACQTPEHVARSDVVSERMTKNEDETVSERVQNGVQELGSMSTWKVVNRLLWMFTLVFTTC